MPCVLPSLEESSLTEIDEKKLKDVEECMKENRIEGPLMIYFAFKTSPRGLFCALVVVLGSVTCWRLSNEGKNTFRRRNLVEFDINFIQLAPLIPLVKLSSSIKIPIWRSIPPVKRTFAQNYVIHS